MKLEDITNIEQYRCVDNKFRYIYKITNTDTNQYYYGKHTTSDINDGYMGSGIELKKYYELSGFTHIEKTIELFAVDDKDLNNKEYNTIGDKWQTDSMCLNVMPGGNGGFEYINKKVLTTEIRSNNMKNFISSLSDEEYERYTNDKIRAHTEWFDNLTEEELENYKRNLSIGVLNYIERVGHDGLWWTGKHHTEESKKKISESQKLIDRNGSKNPSYGKMWITNTLSHENKMIYKSEKIPNGWFKGRFKLPNTPEQIQKQKENSKPFNWVTNGIINLQICIGDQIPDGFHMGRTLDNRIIEKRLQWSKKHREELKKINYVKYKPMYDIFITYGYEEMKKQFNYNKTREALVQQFKKYIPEFVPQPGKPRKPLINKI